jgi:hypothetical protein
MAMSVAEKPLAETTPRSPHLQLAYSSFAGALYVLFSLWFVLGGFPYLWGEYVPIANEFLSSALLIIMSAVIGTALWYVGYKLEQSMVRPGLRAGIVFAALFNSLKGAKWGLAGR